MISAESRFAATSKLVRVLVEGSKKRFAIVFPRSAGTFLTSRLETSLKDSAVVKISSISSRVSSSSDKRSFLVQRNFVWPDCLSLWVFFGSGIGTHHHFLFFIRFGESHMNDFVVTCWNIFSYKIRADRKLSMSTVDQYREFYSFWTSKIDDCVKCRTYCPPGV